MKFFYLLLIININIFASDQITLNWLNNKPKSIAKDFYIYRYLDQNISSNDAQKAFDQIRFVNDKLFVRYSQKIQNKEILDIATCMQTVPYKLVNKNADCIEIGLTTYKATKLSSKNLNKIIKKIQNKYPNTFKKLEILSSKNKFKTLINSEPKIFFDTFNECGGKYRATHFNKPLPKNFIDKIIGEKEFEQTIKLIITNPKLNILQESILDIDSTNLSNKAVFNLAINAIRHNKIKLALNYLIQAYNSSYYQMDKDKVLFWQYKLTNDKSYLDKLANSWDINIYSLFAYEKINKEPKNIIYDLNISMQKNTSFDHTIPFNWFPILKDTKKMNKSKMEKYEKLLNTNDTLGHLAFVKERFFDYKKSFFITPYYNTIKKYDINRQALIYAIARQESRFIPTSISSAYALGVMQIMPFLSKHIAKELKEPYDIDKQLEAKESIKYGNYHLTILEKKLQHPLFISYAYNGGIGFTKKLFGNGLFKHSNKYEPYLSMELLPYDETKKYGKKVLANYFMYKKYLEKDKNLKFSTLIQSLNKSSHI